MACLTNLFEVDKDGKALQHLFIHARGSVDEFPNIHATLARIDFHIKYVLWCLLCLHLPTAKLPAHTAASCGLISTINKMCKHVGLIDLLVESGRVVWKDKVVPLNVLAEFKKIGDWLTGHKKCIQALESKAGLLSTAGQAAEGKKCKGAPASTATSPQQPKQKKAKKAKGKAPQSAQGNKGKGKSS
jgi:hypothetical protein